MMGAHFSHEHHERVQKKTKRKRVAQLPSSAATVPPVGNFGTLKLTEPERIALRAKQREAVADQDLVGYQRRQYQHQDGSHNYSEPHRLPPRHDLRNMNVLTDDPDMKPDTENGTEGLKRIADLSPRDAVLNKLDQIITDAFSVVRNLGESARRCRDVVDRNGSDESRHHAEQIQWITEEALLPWLNELSQNFDDIMAPEEEET